MTSPLRIALIGSRGIPARYGGYETLLQEIAPRLVAAGHQVTVYCRPRYTRVDEREVDGVRLIRLPTVPTKYLDTPVHTLLSCLHAFRRYDVALVVNGANALFVPLLRLGGVRTALHVDGIEKRRAKWGPVGRAVYALSERLACRVPNALVTDAAVIDRHYRERYGAPSQMITYGVDPRRPATEGVLTRLGLRDRGYFLYVSRFEPENNPHRVAEAYRDVGGDLPLVMVGDAPYADRFIAGFRDHADPRVVFPGAIYGDGYRELMSHARAYIHATEVGGTHPALVEAMGYGNCVVVHDTPENREVVAGQGLLFDANQPGSLANVLERLRLDDDEARRRGERAAEHARSVFDWGAVARRYGQLFSELARPQKHHREMS